MTNTRISWDTAFIDQDMITQILEMKRTVATGTYASVTVTEGTGDDKGKYIFTFTDQEGTATVFKLSAKQVSAITSEQGSSANKVKVIFTFNDGTTTNFEFDSVQGAVTTDTQQTISATKTFTAVQNFNNSIDVTGLVNATRVATTGNISSQQSITGLHLQSTTAQVSGLTAQTITGTGNATIAGTLGVTGAVTASDDVTVGGDLSVTGQADIGNLSIEDSSSDSVISSAGAVKVSQSGGTAYPIVDTGSTQTISAVKTFTADPIVKKSSPQIIIKHTTDVRGTAPSSLQEYAFTAKDSANKTEAQVLVQHTTSNDQICEVNTRSGDTDSYKAYVRAVRNETDNESYAQASNRAYSSANSADIITKGHIASITDLVHTTGAENIAGVKTFTNAIYGSAISCQVDFKGSGTAGKYREIAKIAKTALTQVRQHLVFAITSRVRSRGIDIFSVYCSESTPGSITLCLRSNSDDVVYVLSHDSDYVYLSLYCYGDTRDAPQGGIIFCTIGQPYIENLTTYPLTDELTGTEVGRLTP